MKHYKITFSYDVDNYEDHGVTIQVYCVGDDSIEALCDAKRRITVNLPNYTDFDNFDSIMITKQWEDEDDSDS
jgi:predicted amidohydrolase YtcJ